MIEAHPAVASLLAREPKSDAQLLGTWLHQLKVRTCDFEMSHHGASKLNNVFLAYQDLDFYLKKLMSYFPYSGDTEILHINCGTLTHTATFTRGFNSAPLSSSRLFREPLRPSSVAPSTSGSWQAETQRWLFFLCDWWYSDRASRCY